MSWAPYFMASLSASTRVWTERKLVEGGTTTTSTWLKSWDASARVHESFCTKCVAWWWSRFIFQLPAISGVRVVILMCLSAQNFDSRQGDAFEKLQRRSPTC